MLSSPARRSGAAGRKIRLSEADPSRLGRLEEVRKNFRCRSSARAGDQVRARHHGAKGFGHLGEPRTAGLGAVAAASELSAPAVAEWPRLLCASDVAGNRALRLGARQSLRQRPGCARHVAYSDAFEQRFWKHPITRSGARISPRAGPSGEARRPPRAGAAQNMTLDNAAASRAA